MRRRGLGRRGPGLLGRVARTAVVAGPASAVAGGVAARPQEAARAPRGPEPAAPAPQWRDPGPLDDEDEGPHWKGLGANRNGW